MADEFKVHLLNDIGLERAGALATLFETFLAELDKRLPPGRERALVVTKLQEANFWAKRSIAIQVENQVKTDGQSSPSST